MADHEHEHGHDHDRYFLRNTGRLSFPYCLEPEFVTEFSTGRHMTDIGTTLEGIESRQLLSEVPANCTISLQFTHKPVSVLVELYEFIEAVRSDLVPFEIPGDHPLWDLIPCSFAFKELLIEYPGWRLVLGDTGVVITPHGCTHASFELTLKNLVGESGF